MKKGLFILLIFCFSLTFISCTEKDEHTTTTDTPTSISGTLLFTDNLTGTELGSIVYDSTNDFLFHNRSRESSTNDCNIRRYKFSDGSLSTVFKEEYCQFNYGLRLFSNELWVIGTYDKRLLRLNGLDNDTLNNLGYFPSGNWGNPYGGSENLTEVGDLTLTNGNIYLVTHNTLTSSQHNGIKILYGSGFTSFGELISSSVAGWTTGSGGFYRSIISVSSGIISKFVVATGSTDQRIQLWNLSGTKLNELSGYGNITHLVKDSQDRVYFFDGSKIYRFSADLNTKEEYSISGDFTGNRIAVRETGSNVQVITTSFRSRSPSFYYVNLPL